MSNTLIGSGVYGRVYSTDDSSLVSKSTVNDENGIPASTMREISALNCLEQCKYTPDVVKVAHKPTTTGMVMHRYQSSVDDMLDIDNVLARKIIYSVLRALHAAQSYGIFHRDIKPSNILVDNDDIVLADWGLSRFGTAEYQKDITNYVQALEYRAPELLLGETRYGYSIEIWSVGMLMVALAKKPDSKLWTSGAACGIGCLFEIFSIFGTPNADHWPESAFLPHWKWTFPKFRGCGIESHMQDVNPEYLDLVKKMLVLDPKRRITVTEALHHQYFAGMGEVDPIDVKKTLSRTLYDFSKYSENCEPDKRYTLVDWMIRVNIYYELSHQTVFLAVRIVDSILSQNKIPADKLQLIGITAVMMASKIYDISHITVSECQHLCCDAYKRRDILEMESALFGGMLYNLYTETEYSFYMLDEPDMSPVERINCLSRMYLALLCSGTRTNTPYESYCMSRDNTLVVPNSVTSKLSGGDRGYLEALKLIKTQFQ